MSLSDPSSAVPRSSVRDCLRDATHAWHARLESTAFAQAPFSPDLTRAGYAAHLAHWYSVIAPLEKRIARCLATAEGEAFGGRTWQYQPRHPDLAADLLALGCRAPHQGVDTWTPTRLPHALWEAVGAAYVMEGARLGGQVIARQLRKALGEDIPLSYYDGSMAPWRAFLSVIERDSARQNVERMAAGAVNAFCGIHECVAELPSACAV